MRKYGESSFFFLGDVKRLRHFPYVTWADPGHLVDYDEVLEVLPLIEFGDVGLHRDSGYLSNLAIPGFMKHAWIHVDDGMISPLMVEAISEGVVQRNPIYPLFSDYTMILTPRDVTEDERKGACRKAKGLVGEAYDVNFEFDIEDELMFYGGKEKMEAILDLHQCEQYMKSYDHAFSCTELVAYAWWHKREALRLFRRKRRGKRVIIADDFINSGWKIKWMSRSVTPDSAAELGLGEEGLLMISSHMKEKNLGSQRLPLRSSGC